MPSSTTADPNHVTSGPLLDAERRVIQETANQIQAAGGQLAQAIRRQPLTAAVIIFVAGYVFGKIT